VILPQALRSMVPPWVSLYCIVTLSTSLANLLGVEEVMTTTALRLAGETRPDLLLPAHAYTFVLFFLYIYPISLLSRRLEKKMECEAMNHHQTPNGSQIVIRNLVKAYGDNIVLDGISLDVKRSEIAC